MARREQLTLLVVGVLERDDVVAQVVVWPDDEVDALAHRELGIAGSAPFTRRPHVGARAARMGHKTSVESEIRQAVDLARRVRGSVMLVVDGDQDQWCAACAAVDESVELRVAQPRRGWRRWKPAEGEAWLCEQGFVPGLDAWTLPVPSATDARECARVLADAVLKGLGVDSGAQLVRALVHPGALGHELPAPDAPHEEHIAAALRSLGSVGRGRATIKGGRPSELWAWIWVLYDGRSLLVEYEAPRAAADGDTWTVPLTLDAARTAAQDLTRRIEAERPRAFAEPMSIALIGID